MRTRAQCEITLSIIMFDGVLHVLVLKHSLDVTSPLSMIARHLTARTRLGEKLVI